MSSEQVFIGDKNFWINTNYACKEGYIFGGILHAKNTVVIQLEGALGYKTHPQFGNFIITCFQTENIAKILGYKAHRCLGSKDRSSLL